MDSERFENYHHFLIILSMSFIHPVNKLVLIFKNCHRIIKNNTFAQSAHQLTFRGIKKRPFHGVGEDHVLLLILMFQSMITEPRFLSTVSIYNIEIIIVDVYLYLTFIQSLLLTRACFSPIQIVASRSDENL